jgi:hypothetical protein
VIGESDKSTLEKMNEDEDGQLQEKLSRKRRKRKKGKHENGMELNTEKSEAVETERETDNDVHLKKCKREKIHEIEGVNMEIETGHSQSEDDNTPPKKKKKKKSDGSGVEGTEGKVDMAREDTSIVHQSYDTEMFLEKKTKTEVDTGHSQPEDDNTPPKKKKRKKSEGSGVEGTEGKIDVAYEDTSSVHLSCDTETVLGKKRQKRKNVVVEETCFSELQQGMSGVECEDEVEKKMKIKPVQWNEEVDDGTGPAEETAEEGAEVVKKKTRKRKKHKKDKQDVEVSRLQILSKYVTWLKCDVLMYVTG